MSVITITGRVGRGKTLNMTNEACMKFRSDNSLFSRLKRDYVYTNNIFSNYPIKLKSSKKKFSYYDENKNIVEIMLNNKIKRYELFSNHLRLFDMHSRYDFGSGASFYIDEFQAQYDSMDYKDFPDCIAHFFQHHRHLEYNDIFTNSQSLSRIIKRVLVLSAEYWEIKRFYNLFGIIGLCKYKITYDLVAGSETKLIAESMIEMTFKNRVILLKPLFKAYDTKYLRGLKDGAELYKKVPWQSLKMSRDDIIATFFPTKDERQKLADLDY